EILECYDRDDDNRIGPQEFEQFMQNPEVHETMVKFGTDPGGLIALHEAGLIFKDAKRVRVASLTFQEFIQFVLQLKARGAALRPSSLLKQKGSLPFLLNFSSKRVYTV
ncbi:unnamed protein product, partial [Prorocentrum cordatum]